MIDIIIPVHDRPDWAVRCIRAVRKHADRPYRLIVAHDCSDNFTVRSCEAALTPEPGHEFESECLTLIDEGRTEPICFAKTVNHAATIVYLGHEGTKNDLLILHSDCIVNSGFLGRIEDTLHFKEKIGIACTWSNENHYSGHMTIPNGEDINSVNDFVSGIPVIENLHRPRAFCMAIKRAMLDEIGLLDASFECHGADMDFWVRGMKSGWSAALAPTFVYHAGGQSYGVRSREVEQAGLRLLRERHGKALQHLELEWKKRSQLLRYRKTALSGGITKRPKTLFVLNNLGRRGGINALIEVANEIVLSGGNATLVETRANSANNPALETAFFAPYRFPSKERAISGIPRLVDAGSVVAGIAGLSSVVKKIEKASGLKAFRYIQDDEVRFRKDTLAEAKTKADMDKCGLAVRQIIGEYGIDMPSAANSDFSAASLERESGKCVDMVIPMGIDPLVFHPRPKFEKPTVLAFARKEYRRNPNGIREIMNALKAKFGDAMNFILIGDGFMHPMKGLTQYEYMDKHRTAEMIGRSHFVIDPSHYAGLPLPGLEAMASGTVYLCNRNGGIDDYGVDGVNCRIFESPSPDLYVEAVEKLLDPDAYAKIVTGGLKTANEYHYSDIAMNWLKFLNQKSEVRYEDPKLDVISVVVTHGVKQKPSAEMTVSGLTDGRIIVVDSNNEIPVIGVRTISYKDSEYQGKPKSMRLGMEAALNENAKYIYVSMNDVVLPSGGLTQLVEFMDAHPRCGIATPLFFTNGKLNIEGQWEGMETQPTAHFECLSFIIRPETVRNIGFPDESCRMSWGTSMSYPLRVWDAGWECWKVAEVHAKHLGGTTNGHVTKYDRISYYKQAFGEWGIPLTAKFNGDFFAAMDWIKGFEKLWADSGVSAKSVEHFKGVLRLHGSYFWTHQTLSGKWKSRGKPVILFVAFSGGVGGVEYIFGHIGQEFQKKGYDVLYLFWDSSEPAPWVTDLPCLLLPDIKHGLVKHKAIVPERLDALAAVYDSLKPEAVFTYFERDAIRALKRSKHQPKIMEWIDGKDPADCVLKSQKAENTLPSLFICETDGGKKQMEATGIPCEVSGPPIRLYEPNGKDLGLPKDKTVVLRIARATDGKGLNLFNNLMQSLGDGFYGIWIGPEDGSDSVKIAKRLAPKNAHYIGPVMDQRDISTYIQAADIVVSTTITNLEGMSSVLIQALCMGKLVVATDSGYTNHLIRNGENGVLVPLGINGEAMAKVVKAITFSDAERMRGNAVLEREKYNLKTVSDKWERYVFPDGRRAVFVYPCVDSDDAYGMQIGISALAGVLKADGWDPDIIPVRSKSAMDALSTQVADAHFVGIHLVQSQLQYLEQIIAEIRKTYSGRIVAGGPYPTLKPEKALPFVDAVARGEADDVITAIARGESDVPGLVTDINRLSVAPMPKDITTLPMPFRPHERMMNELKINGGRARFLFARGCPFSCTFCCNSALRELYGQPYVRRRTAAQAIEEVKSVIAEFGQAVKIIHFDDDEIDLKHDWLVEFMTRYKAEIGLPFAANIHPQTTTEESLIVMRDAGCDHLIVGVQTGDEEFNRVHLKRNVSNEKIETLIQAAKRIGIKVVCQFIIGLPEETPEITERSIEFARKLKPYATCVYAFAPYEGTEAGDKAVREGWISRTNGAPEREKSNLSMPNYPEELINKNLAEWGRRVHG